MERVVVDAPAKVNLRLEVLAREDSGYHGLETIFCAIGLCDTLALEPAEPGLELAVEGGVDTGPADQNLVVRAARRFHAELGVAPALRISLTKRIPSAAGLGGGSSDAAATLRALNAMHDAAVDEARLRQWGAELGSDVAFFLCGSTLALGWGRGERLLALPPLPARPVLVAHPGAPVPTAGAFREIAAARGGEYRPAARTLALEEITSWSGIARVAHNDFQPVAVRAIPRVATGIELLRRHGAAPAMLAGSGGSIFGVFGEGSDLRPAAAALEGAGFATWATGTLQALPPVRPA